MAIPRIFSKGALSAITPTFMYYFLVFFVITEPQYSHKLYSCGKRMYLQSYICELQQTANLNESLCNEPVSILPVGLDVPQQAFK